MGQFYLYAYWPRCIAPNGMFSERRPTVFPDMLEARQHPGGLCIDRCEVADTPDLGNCIGKAGAAIFWRPLRGKDDAVEQELLLDRLDRHIRPGAGAHDVLQPLCLVAPSTSSGSASEITPRKGRKFDTLPLRAPGHSFDFVQERYCRPD